MGISILSAFLLAAPVVLGQSLGTGSSWIIPNGCLIVDVCEDLSCYYLQCSPDTTTAYPTAGWAGTVPTSCVTAGFCEVDDCFYLQCFTGIGAAASSSGGLTVTNTLPPLSITLGYPPTGTDVPTWTWPWPWSTSTKSSTSSVPTTLVTSTVSSSSTSSIRVSTTTVTTTTSKTTSSSTSSSSTRSSSPTPTPTSSSTSSSSIPTSTLTPTPTSSSSTSSSSIPISTPTPTPTPTSSSSSSSSSSISSTTPTSTPIPTSTSLSTSSSSIPTSTPTPTPTPTPTLTSSSSTSSLSTPSSTSTPTPTPTSSSSTSSSSTSSTTPTSTSSSSISTPISTPTPTPTPTTSSSSSTSSSSTPAATCTALPSSISLQSNRMLPDPFTFWGTNGTRTITKSDLACRQAEIKDLLQRYETGTLPGPPANLSATLSGTTLTINTADSGKSMSFSVTITLPRVGTAPYPAIIGYGGGSLPAPSAVAMINFNNDDMAAQVSTSSRGQGKFYTLYGSTASASAMTAWAWGVSRIIDALELTPAAKIDTTRIGVTGCSRNGKGALLAGAFEPRIALTLPQESGAGGSACWRISDYYKAQGANIQTASEIINEDPWFSTTFSSYVNTVPLFPFDHHSLAALIAPRGLFVIDNNIDWLGPQSCWGCMSAASRVWEALGEGDSMGYSQIGTHGHCAFPSNQQAQLNAFVGRFLLGQSTNTSIMVSDFGFNASQWIDWSTPTLV